MITDDDPVVVGILFPTLPLLDIDDVELAEDDEDEDDDDEQDDDTVDEEEEQHTDDLLRLLTVADLICCCCTATVPSKFRPIVFRNSRITWSSHT